MNSQGMNNLWEASRLFGKAEHISPHPMLYLSGYSPKLGHPMISGS